MSIIPRKAQLVIAGLFALFMCWVLSNWLILDYSPEDFLDIIPEDITRVYVEKNGEILDINKEYWPSIQLSIGSIGQEVSSGFKGENWRYYCNVVLDVEGTYSYVLQLANRPSHGSVIPAWFRRGSVGTHWSYDFYDGTKLLADIRKIIHNQSQHRTINKSVQKDGHCY